MKMQESTVNWLGQEFLFLSADAPVTGNAAKDTQALFASFERVLGRHGLSLADSLRSRLYGCDRAARDAASEVRSAVLAGPARCATSSYIAPDRLMAGTRVAMDLIAGRSGDKTVKAIRENDPPRTPCRYLTWGPLVVLSGQTCTDPTLEAQVLGDILPRITTYLNEAGSGWDRVAEANCFLHEEETPARMRELFIQHAGCLPPRFACHRVAGYSAPGKRVEIEISATRNS
jgi:enamine deaminase RidA (YjgF/YER057c/UK114 family)